jgi:hypothetical protein
MIQAMLDNWNDLTTTVSVGKYIGDEPTDDEQTTNHKYDEPTDEGGNEFFLKHSPFHAAHTSLLWPHQNQQFSLNSAFTPPRPCMKPSGPA